ncbi:hypothetical protein Ga0609869_000028 [Rhodovulum iodosum]|uniref:Uncharacterized protein n=1 Tax=Rhodovulum iodosum TaxID=68291 RepID=A0ABV3XMY0_9RHOB|nr:hypothetical protein [Rhodovulum robiginosum]RSK35818.1 hypothetical protein EJA01_05570 [Rhodovulum robiginosum]
MTVEDIIQTIRKDHAGAWHMLFQITEGGHKFLPSGHVLTPAAYLAVARAFGSHENPVELSAEDRKRNELQAKAEAKNG